MSPPAKRLRSSSTKKNGIQQKEDLLNLYSVDLLLDHVISYLETFSHHDTNAFFREAISRVNLKFGSAEFSQDFSDLPQGK